MTDKAYFTNLLLLFTKLIRQSALCMLRLTFALALLSAVICSGCTEEKKTAPEPARPELKRVVDTLNLHYQKSPPGKNWKITDITSQGNQVLITVAIPPEQASQIMRQPADEQFRLVAEQACPGKDYGVWQQLPAGSSINLLPSTSGQVFIEVRCSH
jgi:hypothetical protein